MPQRAFEAIRATIAHNPTGYYEVEPGLFGPAGKAVDALRGFVGALMREHPLLRFELRASPEVLRTLGLTSGYISLGSEMVFVRHGDTHVAGYIRIAFSPRG
jgi:hypothetical protein